MKLKNDEGEWTEWGEGLEELMIGYFHTLFSPSSCTTKPIIRFVQQKVTGDKDLLLTNLRLRR